MSEAALIRRRRAVDAMGLGPLWTLREAPGSAPASHDEAGVRSVFGNTEARAAAISTMDLPALDAAVTACRACALSTARRHAVPGAGAMRPHWLVVGPAPMSDDDDSGVAMAGPAGRLLDAMLGAVGLSRRESAYVTTTVKCRPPDDRPATATEIASCKPFLDRQVALLAPRMILALGATTAMDQRSIGSDMPVITTRHPAEVLDSPALKAEVWADLCRARDIR